MLRPPDSLLLALASITVVVTTALGWGSWRILDQQRAIDEQRSRDRTESAADALAAGIRGRLAEAGERLSGWVSDPSAAAPSVDGAVVIVARPDGLEINPTGRLPFVPTGIETAPITTAFTAAEAIEFSGDRPKRAIGVYQRLAAAHEPAARAGALLRLGRLQRKLGDFSGALVTYQQLIALGPVRTDGLPAELAGLDGERSTHLALSRREPAQVAGQRILRGLDGGRWLIARGTAEFYREAFTEPRPPSWMLANALSEVWTGIGGRLGPRGQRVFTGNATDSSVLVMWRSNGVSTAALVTAADQFFATPAAMPVDWHLADADGQVIGGTRVAGAQSAARLIGNTEYPWLLRAWPASPSAVRQPGSRAILLGMMGAMLAFVWGASYFMARAIRREAAVARLQSDFVAAVSHEFRSPLTTVRQMAEMLQADRVPTADRRHKYYGILAGEAARLQRLVETLLTFGQMEAGATRYRLVDLDAAALVREVVDDLLPQARESGQSIELDGPAAAIPVEADHGALAVALRNLIDNALKYSPGQPTVWVHCRHDQGQAAISVVDRGVGIPPAEQQTIFGRFVRGRAAIDANIKGTGVGLAMVQQIVAAHGGEVRLDSEPGRGSTFTVLLPTRTS